MKKILFAAGITIIGLSTAFAQDIKQTSPDPAKQSGATMRAAGAQRITPESVAQRKTDRMDKQLTFNEDQKKKVYDVFLKEAQQTQGRAVQNQETDNQLKAIFNEEQNQKYEAMKNERKEMMQRRTQRTGSDLKASPSVK